MLSPKTVIERNAPGLQLRRHGRIDLLVGTRDLITTRLQHASQAAHARTTGRNEVNMVWLDSGHVVATPKARIIKLYTVGRRLRMPGACRDGCTRLVHRTMVTCWARSIH